MTGCQVKVLVTVINRQNCGQPEQLYRDVRDQGITYLKFIPLQARDNPESITDRQWAAFLMAVFDVWVREDIGRIFIQLFDSTLEIWRGNPQQSDCGAIPDECRACPIRSLCSSDSPEQRGEGKSALCAGYQAFFRHSAPHMRVMRDLIRHHRSPVELMALLQQSHRVS
ncbi:radical SAM protein [Leclercia sp.]|uniref:radical SAM protein n=1 Tax=Leclercia sp. TaxID=1898428 RepID=UPI002FDE9391